MTITIEQAQKVLDLRAKMLANIQIGKPAHEGLTQEEYRECLDAVRADRARATAAGVEKAKKKAATGGRKKTEDALATQSTAATNPKFAKFANKNWD
jgi:hypothetical protein